MLSKSIRYEWRASVRGMLPLYLAMALLAVMSNFAQKYLDAGSDIKIINTLSVITMMLFFVGLFVISISGIVLTVQRFYRSFFSDEGYLTMTLPLSTHKLILSRLIVSVIWYALSFFACVLSVFIMIVGGKELKLFPGALRELFSALRELIQRSEGKVVGGAVLLCFELLLCWVLFSALCSLAIYAAMAIGHSFNKHKSLLSVAFAIAFYQVGSFLGIVSVAELAERIFPHVSDKQFTAVSELYKSCTLLGITALLLLLAGAVCYFVSHYFLTKHLNLE